jgi:hypothetical protein
MDIAKTASAKTGIVAAVGKTAVAKARDATGKAVLSQLLPKLNFVPPLADLLYRDPYKTVRGIVSRSGADASLA